MGCNCVCSNSSYDETKVIYDSDSKNPNPDPKNFVIMNSFTNKEFLVLMVNYPNCTNYEGDKILVYRHVSLEKLEQQKSLDPHFSENKDFFSPVARFEPTDLGWEMAVSFADSYSDE